MTQAATMPSLFIPHGGGPAFFMSGPMADLFRPMGGFLAGIGALLPAKPTALLVVTAHWEAAVPTLSGGSAPPLVFDYYGFPPETYELVYRAPGAPELASRAAALLGGAGIDAAVDATHGWDHGVFIPLMVMFPAADIPVVAMSLQAGLDPAAHADIGAALRPLRDDGVLIVGSGMSYHNLRHVGGAEAESMAFDAWLDDTLAGTSAARRAGLAGWADAPSGRASHPREEHLLPLMVASGAGSDAPAEKWWAGTTGKTRVSAWAFR